MTFSNPDAELFIPDGAPEVAALERITHLGIGAHADDLEFMAADGIVRCRAHEGGAWFGGVTCTDGSGSARTGPYAACSDLEMQSVRRGEQRAAAVVGGYAAIAQLAYRSADLRGTGRAGLESDLEAFLRAARPSVVYTHNLADKHPTHLAVAAAAIRALRRLPAEMRPARVYGCEVWRGLDWMPDEEKVAFDLSGAEHLTAALAGVFDSQIAGGKRYDLAVAGRWAANATFHESHATDRATRLAFAMDLTPLVRDPAIDPVAFTLAVIDRFRADVARRLAAVFTPIA